jgi:hypothetical protein
LEPLLEVAAPCGLAAQGGEDRMQAILGHALEPAPAPDVDHLRVGTPIRLTLCTRLANAVRMKVRESKRTGLDTV